MVLIATVALGVLTTYIIAQKKILINQQVKLKADRDVDRAVQMVSSLILNPASCNANFYGKSTSGGSLADIQKCTVGKCLSTGTKTTALALNTYTMFSGENPVKAQLISATYAITQPQYAGKKADGTPSPGSSYPAVLTLTLKFRKTTGLNNGVVTSSTTNLDSTLGYVITLNALVVTATFDYTEWNASTNLPQAGQPWRGLVQSATILGCVQNPSSTVPYGP